jgi:hypothetical protein
MRYLLFLFALPLFAQTNATIQYVTTAPSGSCSARANLRLRTPNGTLYTCQSGTWGTIGGGAGTVTSVTGTANEVSVANGTTTPVISVASTFDISGKTSTAPVKKGTSLPVTCGVGELYFKTDATSAAVLYACTASNTWTRQIGTGTGDVVGPGVATDNAVVVYDGTTGKLVKNSACTIASGVMTCTSFISGDTSKSGADYYQGLTSGGVALAVADVAGTAIVYVLPSTNGAANQVLYDTGATTCPTLAAGFPATCHLLGWTTNIATATALASNPTDCSAGQFANAIAANGNLTCDTPASSAYNPSTGSLVWDDFISGNGSSAPYIGALGWDIVCTGSGALGVVSGMWGAEILTTGATGAGDRCTLYSPNSAMNYDYSSITFNTKIRANITSTANINFFVGMTSGSAGEYGSTDGDFIAISALNADTNYFLVTRSGSGTINRVDTTVVKATGIKTFRIYSTSAGTVIGCVDATCTAGVSTAVPTTATHPAMIVTTSTNAAKVMNVDYWWMQMDLTR